MGCGWGRKGGGLRKERTRKVLGTKGFTKKEIEKIEEGAEGLRT